MLDITGVWKRKSNARWYVTINGRQLCLGETRKQAEIKRQRLIERLGDIDPSTPVVALVQRFLDDVRDRVTLTKDREYRTYEWYHRHLKGQVPKEEREELLGPAPPKKRPAHKPKHHSTREPAKPFCTFIGTKLTVAEFRPDHVERWIKDCHAANAANTRNAAIRAVQAVFRWAVKKQYLVQNPTLAIEKPTPERRDVVVTQDQFDAMLALATDQDEHDMLVTLWRTGCRVFEMRTVTASQVDIAGRRWKIEAASAKGKRDVRIIYLDDVALEITKRRAEAFPDGPIFRHGKTNEPWDRNTIKCRFRKFRSLGIEGLCAGALRHSFATNGLTRGVDPVTLAVLMGHRNVLMLANHYAAIHKDAKHLLDNLKKATTPQEASAASG